MTEQRWYIEYSDDGKDGPWNRWASGTLEDGVKTTLAQLRQDPEQPQGRTWRAVTERVAVHVEKW